MFFKPFEVGFCKRLAIFKQSKRLFYLYRSNLRKLENYYSPVKIVIFKVLILSTGPISKQFVEVWTGEDTGRGVAPPPLIWNFVFLFSE